MTVIEGKLKLKKTSKKCDKKYIEDIIYNRLSLSNFCYDISDLKKLTKKEKLENIPTSIIDIRTDCKDVRYENMLELYVKENNKTINLLNVDVIDYWYWKKFLLVWCDGEYKFYKWNIVDNYLEYNGKFISYSKDIEDFLKEEKIKYTILREFNIKNTTDEKYEDYPTSEEYTYLKKEINTLIRRNYYYYDVIDNNVYYNLDNLLKSNNINKIIHFNYSYNNITSNVTYLFLELYVWQENITIYTTYKRRMKQDWSDNDEYIKKCTRPNKTYILYWNRKYKEYSKALEEVLKNTQKEYHISTWITLQNGKILMLYTGEIYG